MKLDICKEKARMQSYRYINRYLTNPPSLRAAGLFLRSRRAKDAGSRGWRDYED